MELKNCPFCGGEGQIQHGGFGEVMVRCSNVRCDAGLGGGCWQTDEINAAIAWNRRAESDLLAALKDMLAASERHIFGDECKAEREAARAAIARYEHE